MLSQSMCLPTVTAVSRSASVSPGIERCMLLKEPLYVLLKDGESYVAHTCGCTEYLILSYLI